MDLAMDGNFKMFQLIFLVSTALAIRELGPLVDYPTRRYEYATQPAKDGGIVYYIKPSLPAKSDPTKFEDPHLNPSTGKTEIIYIGKRQFVPVCNADCICQFYENREDKIPGSFDFGTQCVYWKGSIRVPELNRRQNSLANYVYYDSTCRVYTPKPSELGEPHLWGGREPEVCEVLEPSAEEKLEIPKLSGASKPFYPRGVVPSDPMKDFVRSDPISSSTPPPLEPIPRSLTPTPVIDPTTRSSRTSTPLIDPVAYPFELTDNGGSIIHVTPINSMATIWTAIDVPRLPVRIGDRQFVPSCDEWCYCSFKETKGFSVSRVEKNLECVYIHEGSQYSETDRHMKFPHTNFVHGNRKCQVYVPYAIKIDEKVCEVVQPNSDVPIRYQGLSRRDPLRTSLPLAPVPLQWHMKMSGRQSIVSIRYVVEPSSEPSTVAYDGEKWVPTCSIEKGQCNCQVKNQRDPLQVARCMFDGTPSAWYKQSSQGYKYCVFNLRTDSKAYFCDFI